LKNFKFAFMRKSVEIKKGLAQTAFLEF